MDTLDEKELESIWRRVKRYVPTGRIKGRNQREVLQSIEGYMRDAGEEQGESGSMNTLLKHGFATVEGVGRIKDFQSHLDEWITSNVPTQIKERFFVSSFAGLPKVEVFSSGRASVQTRRGKRVFAQKNLHVSFSEFKGRKSYYVFNTRTKKRITWEVLNDDKDM
jgi:hypothetical protein